MKDYISEVHGKAIVNRIKCRDCDTIYLREIMPKKKTEMRVKEHRKHTEVGKVLKSAVQNM